MLYMFYCHEIDSDVEPICVLSGHNGNVCALAAGKFGTLLSGSWDW